MPTTTAIRVALWRHLGLSEELIVRLQEAAPDVCLQLRRLEFLGSEEGELPDERRSSLAVQAAPVLRCPALMALLEEHREEHRATLNQLATTGLPPR